MRPIIVPLQESVCGLGAVSVADVPDERLHKLDDLGLVRFHDKQGFFFVHRIAVFGVGAGFRTVADNKAQPDALDFETRADKANGDFKLLLFLVHQVLHDLFRGILGNMEVKTVFFHAVIVDVVRAGNERDKLVGAASDLVNGGDFDFHDIFSLFLTCGRGRIGTGGEIRACRFILGRQAGLVGSASALFLMIIIHVLTYIVKRKFEKSVSKIHFSSEVIMEGFTMAISEARKRANAKWDRENTKMASCKLNLAQYAQFQRYAEQHGKTVSGMVKQLVMDCITDMEQNETTEQPKNL